MAENYPQLKRTDFVQAAPRTKPAIGRTAQMWEGVSKLAAGLADDLDKASLASDARYLARFQNDVDSKFIELRDKHNHDPEGFRKASESYLVGISSSVQGRFLEDAKNYVSKKTNAVQSAITGERRQRDLSLASNELQTRAEFLSNEAAAQAYKGLVDTPEYQDNIHELSGVYSSMVNLGLKSSGQADTELAQVNDQFQAEGIIGKVDMTYQEKGASSARALLDTLRDPEINLSPAQREGMLARGEALLNKRLAADRVPVRNEIDDVNAAARLGLQVPDAKLDALISRSMAVGMEEDAAALTEFAGIQSAASAFAKKPLKEQGAELTALRGSIEQGGEVAAAPRFSALQTVLDNKVKLIEANRGWEFYAAHEIVDPVEPVNLLDADSLAAEVGRRRSGSEAVRAMDGVTLPLLTKAEMDQLTAIHAAGEPRATAGVLSMLAGNLKRDEINAVASKIAPAAPSLAVAMAAGNPVIAERILSGSLIEGEVSKGDVRTKANEMMKGAVTDAAALEPVQDAIYAYYKQLSLMAGDTGENVNAERVEQAVRDVVGPVVEVAGRSFFGMGGKSAVISYRDDVTGDFVDESRLDDILTGITDSLLQKTNGALPQGPEGGTYTAERILEVGRFVTAGDGKYAVVVDGLGYVANADGSVFLLDARKIEKEMSGLRGLVAGQAAK